MSIITPKRKVLRMSVQRSEERFSRNAETDIVCRLLLEKKKYNAYKLSLAGKPAPVLDGMTGDQRFFLGWAQVWRRLYRDQELAHRLVTDSPSPSECSTS